MRERESWDGINMLKERGRYMTELDGQLMKRREGDP